MKRAAELSEPASRSGRLLAAAGLGVELGRRDVVVSLLREVNNALEQREITTCVSICSGWSHRALGGPIRAGKRDRSSSTPRVG
jgi:hypothetical protein